MLPPLSLIATSSTASVTISHSNFHELRSESEKVKVACCPTPSSCSSCCRSSCRHPLPSSCRHQLGSSHHYPASLDGLCTVRERKLETKGSVDTVSPPLDCHQSFVAPYAPRRSLAASYPLYKPLDVRDLGMVELGCGRIGLVLNVRIVGNGWLVLLFTMMVVVDIMDG